MLNEFNRLLKGLQQRVDTLDTHGRIAFLLALSERHASLYSLFEGRIPGQPPAFRKLLDDLWLAASEPRSSSTKTLAGRGASLVPGEEWVVNGFYDALGQYVGGIAADAALLLHRPKKVEHPYAEGAFEALRKVACALRLGYSEPGDNAEGLAFEAALVGEPMVQEEVRFWERLFELIQTKAELVEVRRFAEEHRLDASQFADEIVERLKGDDISTWR